MNVDISILMSVYCPNWNYIDKTLSSIKNQTYRNFELVIVNDGCDNKKLINLLNNYNLKYKLVENIVNIGLARSLNVGLKVCSGEYIARIDADDYMAINRLEEQIKSFRKMNNIAAVFSRYYNIDCNNYTIGESKIINDKNVIKFLKYKGNCLCHSTMMIKKKVLLELNGYDEKMLYSQDYDLYLRIIKKYDILVLNLPLVYFRINSNGLSKKKKILSLLFSYYATLINMNKFEMKMFVVRTFVVIKSLYRIIKE